MSYVDLAQAPYNVVANDPTALDSNTTAIRQALADHPNSTSFMLPMGDIHIHRNLAFGGAYRTAAIQINGVQHNHHDLVFSGCGPDATRLLIDGDQGNTTSQGIQIADGAAYHAHRVHDRVRQHGVERQLGPHDPQHRAERGQPGRRRHLDLQRQLRSRLRRRDP
jgi:hypothetical protein